MAAGEGSIVRLTWFCVWQSEQVLPIAPSELAGVKALVRDCPGLAEGHVLVPAVAQDPHYPDASRSPSLVLQLDFDDIQVLEDHLRPSGYLACLAKKSAVPSLAAAQVGHQAMIPRRYPVPDPADLHGRESISYWVEYAGPAEDAQAWHNAYVRHHPALLAQFPGIRAIEIYTPAVIICGVPIPERPCLQRNKTVFDNAGAMRQAMLSPVRAALREDFHALPPFRGEALHFPFSTTSFAR